VGQSEWRGAACGIVGHGRQSGAAQEAQETQETPKAQKAEEAEARETETQETLMVRSKLRVASCSSIKANRRSKPSRAARV